MISPFVSVLMPVYNAERYVGKAINSILQQTYGNFEFIIINDGSTDQTAKIISTFTDSRIRYFHFEKNEGYVRRLNFGLTQVKGKYVARMDADDVSMSDRLRVQVEFLEKHKDYAVVGSAARFIDEKGKQTGQTFKVQTSWENIRIQLLFHPPLPHPSVMISAEILKRFGYSEEHSPAEDYFLWVKMAEEYKIGNIKAPLLYYRIHHGNTSQVQKGIRLYRHQAIQEYQFQKLKVDYTNEEIALHTLLSANGIAKLDKDDLLKAEKWLIKLVEHTNFNKIFSSRHLKDFMAVIWFHLCLKAARKEESSIRSIYFKSRLRSGGVSSMREAILVVQTVLPGESIRDLHTFLKRIF